MKITRFVISDYHQFGYLNIDLTYPKGHPTKGGQPLDKVCFIGKNGTGKTTILKAIKNFAQQMQGDNNIVVAVDNMFDSKERPTQFCFEIEYENKRYLVGRFHKFLDNGSIQSNSNIQILEDKYYDEDFF